MRDDEADRVAAAHRVPAGQPVGADAALQRREPGHQRDQHDDAVAGEQAGDPAGVGQPVAEPVDRRRVMPPERERRERTRGDQRKDGPRVGAPGRGRGRGGRPVARGGQSGHVGDRCHAPKVPGTGEPDLRARCAFAVSRDSQRAHRRARATPRSVPASLGATRHRMEVHVNTNDNPPPERRVGDAAEGDHETAGRHAGAAAPASAPRRSCPPWWRRRSSSARGASYVLNHGGGSRRERRHRERALGVRPRQRAALRGGGGIAGEQHVQGAVTAKTSSTVTVRSSSGTALYTVDSTSQIVRRRAAGDARRRRRSASRARARVPLVGPDARRAAVRGHARGRRVRPARVEHDSDGSATT